MFTYQNKQNKKRFGGLFMYYTYVLFSEKDKMMYTGYTKDLRERFRKHQKGEIKSTANRRPLILIYFESCLNQKDA